VKQSEAPTGWAIDHMVRVRKRGKNGKGGILNGGGRKGIVISPIAQSTGRGGGSYNLTIK